MLINSKCFRLHRQAERASADGNNFATSLFTVNDLSDLALRHHNEDKSGPTIAALVDGTFIAAPAFSAACFATYLSLLV